MANENTAGNVYVAKEYQNLREVIENAVKHARVSNTKKVLVVIPSKTKEIRFELSADTSVNEALNIWAKAANTPHYERQQNVK